MRVQYSFGSAARQLQPVQPIETPNHRHEELIRKRREREERIEERKRQERALARQHHVNFLYTIGALTIVAFMFMACVQYLQTQAAVNGASNDVAIMEARLAQLTLKNDETQMEIDGSINYDELLRVATEELGMVYPSYRQVVEYDSSESEYVKQYKDIPSSNGTSKR